MSFSNLYTFGFQERNRDHFAALVRIALADNSITEEEKNFLKRVALNLQIDEALFNNILEHSEQYKVNPSYSEEERYDRLYDLIKMVVADEISKESEKAIVRRLSIGLGFPTKEAEKIVNNALEIIGTCENAEVFSKRLKA